MTSRRVFLFTSTLLALLAVAPVARAQDHESRPARAVRYLHRETHLPDGAPLELYVAWVDLCDPAVEVRASAPSEGGRTVSAWAHESRATIAINGDYFDRRVLRPVGPARGGGTWWRTAPREHHDALLVTGHALPVALLAARDPSSMTLWDDARARVGRRWTEVIAARERILDNGNVRQSPVIPHHNERHPRTAVGLSADGRTLILLVADGRSPRSAGLTVEELATTMRDLGARDAVKLDGGGSSAMFVTGEGIVNHPSDGAERVVANHLAIRVRQGARGPAPRWCRESIH